MVVYSSFLMAFYNLFLMVVYAPFLMVSITCCWSSSVAIVLDCMSLYNEECVLRTMFGQWQSLHVIAAAVIGSSMAQWSRQWQAFVRAGHLNHCGKHVIWANLGSAQWLFICLLYWVPLHRNRPVMTPLVWSAGLRASVSLSVVFQLCMCAMTAAYCCLEHFVC